MFQQVKQLVDFDTDSKDLDDNEWRAFIKSRTTSTQPEIQTVTSARKQSQITGMAAD